MQEKSIYKNAIYNLIRKLSELVFPLVTFTYSCRVLGVEGVGKIDFTKSVVSAFILLATLGMNFYGTREGAKVRNDRMALSKYAHEMLLINGLTTMVAFALLILSILVVPKFEAYRALLLVNSLSILLQGMGMEWLYQALEEYKYITLRSLLFKLIALVAMFLFVRSREDVIAYAFIQVIAISGSYVLNLINARRYISFKRFPKYDIKRHLKPLLYLFAMAASIEIYTVLDSTMLGFLQGDIAIGKYSAAIKIERIVNSLIVSAGVVMIPRLSYYISRRDNEKTMDLVEKTYNYMFIFSIPAAIGLFVLSDGIILMFSGKEFASASFTMRVMLPIVLLIPFSNTTNQHILVPMGKEKYIIISTALGAVTNFACNSVLIPIFAENGAAAATVLAETAVAIVCFYNARRFLNIEPIFKYLYQYIIAALPILPLGYFIEKIPIHYSFRMALTMSASIVSYFGILLCFRNKYVFQALNRFLKLHLEIRN